MTLTNNATIYLDGHKIGTIHESARSRRWYFKAGTTISPAQYGDAEEAAQALKKARAGVTA